MPLTVLTTEVATIPVKLPRVRAHDHRRRKGRKFLSRPRVPIPRPCT